MFVMVCLLKAAEMLFLRSCRICLLCF